MPRPPRDFPYTNVARGRDLDFVYTNCSIAFRIDFSIWYLGRLTRDVDKPTETTDFRFLSFTNTIFEIHHPNMFIFWVFSKD